MVLQSPVYYLGMALGAKALGKGAQLRPGCWQELPVLHLPKQPCKMDWGLGFRVYRGLGVWGCFVCGLGFFGSLGLWVLDCLGLKDSAVACQSRYYLGTWTNGV